MFLSLHHLSSEFSPKGRYFDGKLRNFFEQPEKLLNFKTIQEDTNCGRKSFKVNLSGKKSE